MALPYLILLSWLAFVTILYFVAWIDYLFYVYHWNKKLPILWNSLFDQ